MSSTRLGAAGIRSFPGPPSPLLPWHGAHLAKTTLPAAIDSGVDAIGFLTLAASGLPWAATTIRAAQASTSAAIIVRNRRESTRCAPVMMSAHFISTTNHEPPTTNYPVL